MCEFVSVHLGVFCDSNDPQLVDHHDLQLEDKLGRHNLSANLAQELIHLDPTETFCAYKAYLKVLQTETRRERQQYGLLFIVLLVRFTLIYYFVNLGCHSLNTFHLTLKVL